jgi:SEC-C motif
MHVFEEMVRGKVVLVRGDVWTFDDSAQLVSPVDPRAGEPCWCHSGQAFESCHLLRQGQAPFSKAEFLANWEAAADIEMCLHPAAPTGCSPLVIRAHTVQRMGGGLKQLATSGEVYGFKLHPTFIQKNDGIVIPEKIGLKRASTFRGFCENHDAELFRPVETKPFSASSEQLLLLNFRAVARRVYGREVAFRHKKNHGDNDRGLPPNMQRILFVLQEGERLHAEDKLANIRALKVIYDHRLVERDFSDMNAFVTVFSGAPEVALAEIVGVDADFTGGTLRHPDPPAHLVVYTVGVDGGTALIFSWLGANSAAEDLCRSFAARPDEEKAAAFLRYAVEYVDNLYFAPQWWEGLTPDEQSIVISALTSRMHPFYVRHPSVLENRAFVTTSARYTGSFAVGSWSAA